MDGTQSNSGRRAIEGIINYSGIIAAGSIKKDQK